MHGDLGVVGGLRHMEEVAHGYTGPALRRTPPFDTRDRQRGVVLRERGEVVEREAERVLNPSLDDEAVRRIAQRR